VPSFAGTEDLLAAGPLDGLIVATVEDAHLAPCLAALERNVGVLVEKPLATTMPDGQAIVDAARHGGALLMVGHILRFDARYALLRDAVAAGEVGQPLTVYARRLNGKGAQRRLRGRCSLPTTTTSSAGRLAARSSGSSPRNAAASSPARGTPSRTLRPPC
jgi:predicted dehydrogenase